MSSLVGEAETQNWLSQHSCVMIEGQQWRIQRISQLQRSSLRIEGFQLHTMLPSPEHQCWEEEPPKHLAVKMSGYSIHLGEKEHHWKARCPLKTALTQICSLAGNHSGLLEGYTGINWLSERHIGVNWLVCFRAMIERTATSLCWALPLYGQWVETMLSSPPRQLNLNLH